jgi:adenosylcobinamide-GDP ribazoletransferase
LLLALVLSAAAALWMRQWLQRRLQGFTGDGLGAAEQVSEIAFYLGAALSLGPAGLWLAKAVA